MSAVSGRLAVSVAMVVTECCRSALLTQLFGVVESDPLTLVAYDGRFMLGAVIVDAKIFVELTNGWEWVRRYREENMIVYRYLIYTHVRSTSVPLFQLRRFFRLLRSNLCAKTRL